jgi:hypothetical protein
MVQLIINSCCRQAFTDAAAGGLPQVAEATMLLGFAVSSTAAHQICIEIDELNKWMSS